MAEGRGGKKPREDMGAIIAKVIAKAWKSEEYLKRFLADPVKVLTDEGIAWPREVRIQVHVDEERLKHFVVPVKPRGLGADEEERKAIEWCSAIWCSYREDH